MTLVGVASNAPPRLEGGGALVRVASIVPRKVAWHSQCIRSCWLPAAVSMVPPCVMACAPLAHTAQREGTMPSCGAASASLPCASVTNIVAGFARGATVAAVAAVTAAEAAAVAVCNPPTVGQLAGIPLLTRSPPPGLLPTSNAIGGT